MNKLLLCIILVFPLYLTAQKMPKIDKEMLQEVQHSDSSAHASYLLHNCEAEFLFTPEDIFLVYKIKERIKIYDNKGLSYADFTISLYEQNNKDERVSKIKATTYNYTNGKIEKTELHRKKDVYEEQSSDNWKQVKFAMPNVKAGSIIDVEYSIRSPYIYQMNRWYFQNDIPVDYSLYKIKAPKYFVYTPVPKGHLKLETKKEEILTSKHGEVEYTYVGRNLPAVKEDEFVLNKNDYRSSIKFELYATQFPNQIMEYYSKDWNKIAEQLMSSKDFGKQIRSKLKNIDFDFSHASSLENQEKIKYVYDYVRINYTWNEDYGIYSREGLKKLLETKNGSIGDINLLLLNLLKKCDISVQPFVSKSRNSGLLNESFPTMTDLNYLMAYIPNEDGSYMLLDASSRFSPLGQIPSRAINTTGVVLYGNRGEVIYQENTDKYSITTMANYEIDLENTELVGEAKRVRDGYSALSYRLSLQNEDNADADDGSSSEDEDDSAIEVKNEYEVTSVENTEDIYSKIKQEYSEIIREEINQIGSNIFINASLDFGREENPFKEETRNYPVFFTYPTDIKNIVTITIPDGYAFESIPESVSLTLPNKSASFRYSVDQQEDKILIRHFFTVSKVIFLDSEYPDLKEFYNRVIQKNNEKFVLVKTE